MIDNFLTPTEVNRFLDIAEENSKHFKRSLVEVGRNERVEDPARTSTALALAKAQDKVIFNLELRAAELLGVGWDNLEPTQLVKYENGAKFGLHHDCGEILEDNTIAITEPRSEFTFHHACCVLCF